MRTLLNLIFAKKCEFCGRLNFRVCPKCLAKLVNDYKSQDGTPYFLSYQDEKVRKFIWKFKYKNEMTIAKDLAPLFGDYIYEMIESDLKYHNQPVYLIPAPITQDPTRYRLKNHMLVLAVEVKKYLDNFDIKTEINDCLQKTGSKRSAMIFGKKKRTENIEKHLILKKEPPTSGLIFILDDVTTTGTTIRKIKKLIQTKVGKKTNTGRAWIQALVLAH